MTSSMPGNPFSQDFKAEQPPQVQAMTASAKKQPVQLVQTEEEGPAARVRGGCIPCPVSQMLVSVQRKRY